jgi:hypothetical protein
MAKEAEKDGLVARLEQGKQHMLPDGTAVVEGVHERWSVAGRIGFSLVNFGGGIP